MGQTKSRLRVRECPLAGQRSFYLVRMNALAAARPWRMEKLETDAVMDASLDVSSVTTWRR